MTDMYVARPQIVTVNAERNSDSNLLSLLEQPEEGCHGTDVKSMSGDGHDVIQDASHLSIQNYKHNKGQILPLRVEMIVYWRCNCEQFIIDQ